jgi:hypothetical protein
MKPFITKIIIIIIAVAIVAPATYFAYEYYSKSNVSPSVQPFQYIPGNSTMISTVHSNGTEYYLYLDGGSLGIVANTSAVSITNSNITATDNPADVSGSVHGNLFSGSNVKTTTYDHITVYEIQNVSLTGILGNLSNSTGKNLTNTTVNIFAYSTSGNFMVLGQQKAINESITAHMTSKDAVQLKGYLNQSANTSLYYNVNNTIPTISYITANSTGNRTYVNIIPTNENYITLDKLLIQTVLSNPKFSNVTGNNYTIHVSNGIIHLDLNKGFSNLPDTLKTLNIIAP